MEKINSSRSSSNQRTWTRFKNPALNRYDDSGDEEYERKQYVFEVEEEDDDVVIHKPPIRKTRKTKEPKEPKSNNNNRNGNRSNENNGLSSDGYVESRELTDYSLNSAYYERNKPVDEKSS